MGQPCDIPSTMSDSAQPLEGQRGKPEHHVREQIINAANEHFRHFGYAKTTVSDLAKAIGFSKAYIYKFFDSKQAIGESICSHCLVTLREEAAAEVAGATSAADRLRRLYKSLFTISVSMFFTERRLYDIAAHAASEKWPSSVSHQAAILEIVKDIILEGREKGEFERKTPLDETCRAICLAMHQFVDPLMLQHNLDTPVEAVTEVSNLVLRSLAP